MMVSLFVQDALLTVMIFLWHVLDFVERHVSTMSGSVLSAFVVVMGLIFVESVLTVHGLLTSWSATGV